VNNQVQAAEKNNSIFLKEFYGEQITNELDQRLEETTKNLESRLIKAAEINEDDDGDEVEDENAVEVSALEQSIDCMDDSMHLKNKKLENSQEAHQHLTKESS